MVGHQSRQLHVFQISGEQLRIANKYLLRSLRYEMAESEELAILETEFQHRISHSILEDVFLPAPFWGDFRKAFRQNAGMLRSDRIHCGDVISLFYDW